MEIEKLLEERGETHGDFLVTAMAYDPKDPLAYSRDMIRAKLARIYSGKPGETDHWTDIIGYATIALKIMERVKPKAAQA
jgi:hypothetical protein